MNNHAKYQILDSLPSYGPMYVPVTTDGGEFFSEGVVVRFFKSDGTDWVANFEPGWTTNIEVVELKESTNILVNARGACYIMDPEQTTPIATFGIDYSEMHLASKDRLVLADSCELAIIEPTGERWYSPRISWDGLEVKNIENGTVTGSAHDPMDDADEWVEFSFDLDTRVLTGGSYTRYDFKKPWWQFWN